MYFQITDFIKNLSQKSGAILKEGFNKSFNIYEKEGRNNLVTDYDRKSEDFIISSILKEFPNSSILAEESGLRENPNSEINWIIDPLDGTVNFAHKLPVFSVSIAAEVNGEIVSGGIMHPMLDELFYAEKGNGAFINETQIKVSKQDNFLKSLLVTGFPYNVFENPSNCVDVFIKIITQGVPVRRLGSAALDLAYTAMGRFDGFWEINLHPWDVAAGYLICQEAGGTITNYNNEEYSIFSKSILATNGLIHQQLLEQINSI